MNRRALLLAPLGVAVLAGAGFWTVLGRMREGRFDPHDVPSPLVGQRVPDFALPPLPGHEGFDAGAVLAQRRPVLVNFFASWCLPCAVEHPELMALSREGLAIWGVAYKDAPDAANGFLERRGNPFGRTAMDRPGRVAIDWGVYGVPESFLVDRDGVIRWRQAGPVTSQVAREQLRPWLKRLG